MGERIGVSRDLRQHLGHLRAHADRIAEANRFRSPVAGSVRLSLTSAIRGLQLQAGLSLVTRSAGRRPLPDPQWEILRADSAPRWSVWPHLAELHAK
jgi:hypothetical protein